MKTDPIREAIMRDFQTKIDKLYAQGMLIPTNLMQVVDGFVTRTHRAAHVALAQKIRADYAAQFTAGVLASPAAYPFDMEEDESPVDVGMRLADELMHKCGIWANDQMGADLHVVNDDKPEAGQVD